MYKMWSIPPCDSNWRFASRNSIVVTHTHNLEQINGISKVKDSPPPTIESSLLELGCIFHWVAKWNANVIENLSNNSGKAFPPSITCLNSSKLKNQQWNPCYLLEEGDLKVTLPFHVGSQWRCTSSMKRLASGGKFRKWVPKTDPILKCRRSFEGHLRGQIYKEIVPAHLELQTYTRREGGNTMVA